MFSDDICGVERIYTFDVHLKLYRKVDKIVGLGNKIYVNYAKKLCLGLVL